MCNEERLDHIDHRCRECNATESFEHIHVENYESSDECPEEYTLARCKICDFVSLFYREDVELLTDKMDEPPEYYYLWPAEERRVRCELPKLVGESYTEAIEAEKAELSIAAGAMIGRTVEAVCKDFDSNSKGIFEGLLSMKEAGALSDEMYDWANELRILRNEAAHAQAVKFSQGDVGAALDFLQALLEIIYLYRPAFERFKQARSTSDQGSS